MRKVITLVGIALVAFAGSARAQDEAPAAAPAPEGAAPAPAAEAAKPAASQSKIQVGLNLLPMVLGKYSASAAGVSTSGDLKFAYGVGIHASYVIIPGLTVGIAPQMLLNVKAKDDTGDASKEYDIFARIAYAYPVADKISVYAEVLPGYSIVSSTQSGVDAAKGLVLAGGVGGAYDITDQIFVNLGVGYQMGFQKTTYQGTDVDFKTKFLRIAVGAGAKF